MSKCVVNDNQMVEICIGWSAHLVASDGTKTWVATFVDKELADTFASEMNRILSRKENK